MGFKLTMTALKRQLQRTSLVIFAASFSGMMIHASGLAAFVEIDYNVAGDHNIVITPINTPIVWPKDGVGSEIPGTYGEDESLSAEKLLEIDVCLTSDLCTAQAINAGAVYFDVKDIAGIGEVVFYYDEYGRLIGSQEKTEVAAGEPEQEINANNLVLESTELPENVITSFGDFGQYEVGSTNAEFQVDPSGTANYSIPLYTPPGIGDMQPTLSINYGSQGSNGLLGVGFTVSGLSTVTRCPKTRAQDGISQVALPIKYNNQDEFCLDGQRLMKVSGTHGQSGAIYRSEIDNFSRVEITDHNSYGPLTFEVKTKSAQTLVYGATGNSRILLKAHANGSNNNVNIMVWALEDSRDVAGNNIHYDYIVNASTTGYRPDRITYGAPGFEAVIAFDYDSSRFDAREGYQQGYKMSAKHRMKAVSVSVAGHSVRDYNFTYDESSPSRRSRMQAIQECVPGGQCLPPITFDWSDGPDKYKAMGALKSQQSSQERDTAFFNYSDFNNDGQTDIVIGPNGNGRWLLLKGKDGSLENYSVIANDWVSSMSDNPRRLRMLDLNGDGHLDILAGPDGNGNWRAQQRNAAGTAMSSLGTLASGQFESWKDNEIFINQIDLNADGKQDLIIGPDDEGDWSVLRSNGSSLSRINNYVYRAFSDQPWHVGSAGKPLGPDHTNMFDVNGDGLTDILLGPGTDGYWDLLKNTGSGFSKHNNYISRHGSTYSTTGRGSCKYWTQTKSSRYCSRYNIVTTTHYSPITGTDIKNNCTSNTTKAGTTSTCSLGYNKHKARNIRPVDVNGDGLADLVSGPRSDNKWYVWINTGVGFKAPVNWYSGLSSYADESDRVFPVDVNADGMNDFLVGPSSSGTWYYLRSTGNGFVRESNIGSPYGEWYNDQHRIHYADITGDGLSEFVLSPDSSTWYGLTPNRSNPDKITGITNGPVPKTTISYQSLATDADPIYSMSDNDSRTLPRFVVKEVKKGNGFGGDNTTSYYYRDLKVDLDGRGARGFKTVEMTDSATNSVTKTTYRQDFPFIGMAASVEQRISGNLVSQITNEYQSVSTAGGNAVYPLNSRSIEQTYEYGQSTAYKTVTTETGFDGNVRHIDDYGNVTWVRVTTAGGGETHVKTTTSEYAADDTGIAWKLGRLTRAVVEHVSPAADPITRESTFDYYANGQLQREHIEPNASEPNLRKTTEYQYDANGLRNRVTETGFHADGTPMTPRTASSTITFETANGVPTRKTVLTNANGESETTWVSLKYNKTLKHRGPNGKETVSQYDPMGRLASTTSFLDVTTRTSYSWTNQNPLQSVYRVTSKTDGIEDDKTVYYDSMNREIRSRTRMLDGRHVIKDSVYNDKGLIARANRPYLTYDTPVWLCFEYDPMGRLVSENRPGANGGPGCGSQRPSTSVTYDGLSVTHVDLLGRARRETRNVMDKVLRVDEGLDASGNPTVDHSWLDYRYDAIQQLKMITDANGQTTLLDYDPNGRKIWMDDPAMGEWSYRYNSFGELEEQTDAKAQKVRIDYDVLGRMVRRDDNYIGTTPGWDWTWTYGNAGNGGPIGKLLAVTGPDGFAEGHAYNNALQAISTTLDQTIDPNGIAQAESLTRSFAYDNFGRVISTTYPGDFIVENVYNAFGHMVAVKSPAQPIDAGAIAKLQAQKAALETDVATAKAEANRFLEDAIRMQANASRYEAYATSLLEGEAAGANAGDAAVLNAAAADLRDISSVLIEKSKTLMLKSFVAAAEADGLEQQIEIGTSSETHNQHRHVALSHADLAVSYLDKARTILDDIESVSSVGATTALLSDIESYLEQAVANVTGYQNQQALADRYYRLAQAVDTNLESTDATVWWTAAEADAEGRVTKSVYGNGMRTERFYDPTNGHLQEIVTDDGVNTLQQLSYQYDNASNVLQRKDWVLGYHEDFTYDHLDRLDVATLTLTDGSLSAGRSWDYDKTGNITSVDGQNYVYNTNPDLASQLVSTPNQGGSFSYDANGNITASGGRNYSWTTFNKPASLSQGSNSARFTYGADRDRINKVNIAGGVVSKTTAYFGGYEKITTTASGEVEHKYHVSAGGALIAVHSVKVGGNPGGSSQTVSSNYLHRDALGSVSVITDASGALVETLAYTPFGKRRDVSALASFTSFTSLLLPSFDPAITKRGYTGHEHIDELDLIHMNGRVYDPAIGRFLSPDPHVQMPKSTQGFNRYAYVQNNPLKYTDPSGYFIKALGKEISGFIRKYGRAIVAIAIMFVPGVNAFAAGFMSGLIASGGDFKTAMISGMMAGTANYLAHGLTTPVAHNPHGVVAPVLEGGSLAAAHGVSQGVFTEMRGGKFKEGFLGAVAAKMMPMPDSLQYAGDSGQAVAARTTFAALSGGITSELGGGKFKNGAISAAFVHLFNDERSFDSRQSESEVACENPNNCVKPGELSISKENRYEKITLNAPVTLKGTPHGLVAEGIIQYGVHTHRRHYIDTIKTVYTNRLYNVVETQWYTENGDVTLIGQYKFQDWYPDGTILKRETIFTQDMGIVHISSVPDSLR